MERNELLKTIGFSDDFLQRLDEYESKGITLIDEPSFLSDSFEITIRETSDFHVNKQIIKDTSSLIFK